MELGHTYSEAHTQLNNDLIDFIEEDEYEEEVFFHLLMMGASHKEHLSRRPCRTSTLRGHDYVVELLNSNDTRCFDCFRMKKDTFIRFCVELKSTTNLKASRFFTVQEQVAIFLLIISHNERNRFIAERFQHSGQTISHYFNHVLKSICKLGEKVICPLEFGTTPLEIKLKSKYYPFFKDCIGAIDGIHISASIPIHEQIPYRGRKTNPTWNIMCVCSFDMQFTFVMSGWEGTANDSRIFLECVRDPTNKFSMPTRDQYYLVDSGYTNMPGFLSPYRGERYHLRDFRDGEHQPREYTREFMIVEEETMEHGNDISQTPIEVNVGHNQLKHMAQVRDRIADQLWITTQTRR